jgi:hypothetical protein
MINLLTGMYDDTSHPGPNGLDLVEKPWTADAHLDAMRRLLNEATNNPGVDPATVVAAAHVHLEASKAAARTPLPVKTGPARIVRREGDAL